MLVAMAMGNKPQLDDARDRLAEIIAETMGVADVLGATLTLRVAAGLWGEHSGGDFSANSIMWALAERPALLTFKDTPVQTILPRVTLTEALQDMVDRTPITIRSAAERTAQRISQLYSEGSVVAFVNSAEAAVTERVKSLIAEAIKEGIPEAETGKLIRLGVDEIRKRTAAWSEGYARMAFRTNVNTAVTAGRFRQSQDPDIRAVIPCFRFDAVMDSDTRGNHGAADGLIFKVDNLVWNKIAPPLGYNCRCQVSFVGLPELRRMGRVGGDGSIREDRLPGSAHADAGFRHGGRPDLFLGGA